MHPFDKLLSQTEIERVFYMDRKQQKWTNADRSAKLSLVLLVLNVVMLVVAATRLFCPEGDALVRQEGGVNLEGICAAAEAAIGVISSGDAPVLDGIGVLWGGSRENAHLGLPPAQVVVIASPEELCRESHLELPEGMTVRKVFIVEAALEHTAGQM